jgi:peptidoglycan/xylan/chitin deacetylase (PgdA/CDA1 family)
MTVGWGEFPIAGKCVVDGSFRRPLLAGLIALLTAAPLAAHAQDCPGHPNALGTSRTLVVDPTEHTKIGTMQYSETLPLKDHEVVLTFDDGPLPTHSNQVLETLASECVKATFFVIGRMAKQYPDGVRRLRDAGHTIGTHSENHPLSFNHMPLQRAEQEIEDGIAHTTAALGGDTSAVSPFFRIPGLLRAEGVEDYLASRGIMTWSADFPADDWRHITPAQVMNYALTRLEAKGKGVLLLHDIQGRTATMLPQLLRELKARGYQIVHVVAATPDRPKTPTEARDWLMHPNAGIAVARWPAVPHFVYAARATTPAPDVSTSTTWLADVSPRPAGFYRPGRFGADAVALPSDPAWPRPLVAAEAAITLPAPDQSLFRQIKIPGGSSIRVAGRSQHAEAMPATLEGTATRPAVTMASATAIQTSAARRQLPGSWPVTTVGLQRGPLTPR